MKNINHIEIGGTIFPASYINGMLCIEYPSQPPKKVSDKEKEQFKKLSEMTRKLIKENNIKFVYNEKDLERNK